MRARLRGTAGALRFEQKQPAAEHGLVTTSIVALLLIVVGLAWHQRPAARTARTLRRLESRYFRKVHMPPHMARDALQRHVARLRDRHPGRGPVWYVAQVLADLERDRR